MSIPLCLSVRSAANGSVKPGGHADFTISVWMTGGKADTATVSISAAPGKLSPRFTACQPKHPATCHSGGATRYTLHGLAASQPATLQARVTVPKDLPAGHLTLTGYATSPRSSQPATASGVVTVAGGPASTPSSSPASSATSPATSSGVGATLPTGGLGPPPKIGGSATLPLLPQPSSDYGSSFPLLAPASTPSPAPVSRATPVPVADVSASAPLDVKRAGTMIAALAAIAALLAFAAGQFTLRRPRGRHGKA